MVSCAGRDPYAKLPSTLESRYKGTNPAPEIRTAVGLITEAGKRRQVPAAATVTGDEGGLFAWKTGVFAGLPQQEQVRYLCHVMGQSTLNAEESVHVSRVVSIYKRLGAGGDQEPAEGHDLAEQEGGCRGVGV